MGNKSEKRRRKMALSKIENVLGMSPEKLSVMIEDPKNRRSLIAAIEEAPDALFFVCIVQGDGFEINPVTKPEFDQLFAQTPGNHADVERALQECAPSDTMFMLQTRHGNTFMFFGAAPDNAHLDFRDLVLQRNESKVDHIKQEAQKHASALRDALKRLKDSPIILFEMDGRTALAHPIKDLEMLKELGLGQLKKLTEAMVPGPSGTDCLVIFLSRKNDNGIMTALYRRDDKALFPNMVKGGDAS